MIRSFYLVFIGFLVLSCGNDTHHMIIEDELIHDPQSTLDYLNDLEQKAEYVSPDLFYHKAKVYLQLEEYDAALNAIEKALEKNKSRSDYYLLKGKSLQKTGNSKDAIENLLIAENLGSRNYELYEILSTQYLKLGEVDKARQAVDRLVKLQGTAGSYAIKGEILLTMRDTLEAKKSFQNSIAIDSQHRESYSQLITLARRENALDEAGKYLNMYLKKQPSDDHFLKLKGQLLVDLQRYDSAKVIFQFLLSIDSLDFNNYYNLSNLYYLQGKYDSSKVLADKALAINDSAIEPLLLKAQTLDRQRNYQEAIDVYDRVLQIDSTQNLATIELDKLKRKVAYLWQLEQQRKKRDSAMLNMPPTLEKKTEIDN